MSQPDGSAALGYASLDAKLAANGRKTYPDLADQPEWDEVRALMRDRDRYRDALLRIEHWPFDVGVTPESDLRAIREHAARALRGES